MENNFEEHVSTLFDSPWPNDLIIKMIDIFEKQTSQTISSFISVSLKSILTIEHWAWQMLSKDSRQWIDLDDCVKFFHVLHSFNIKLISNNNGIQCDTKISLLIPSHIDWIDGILDQIESSNDTFLTLASLWFDTLSYLAQQLSEIVYLPTMQHLNNRLSRDFLMTNQYKFYLKQLCVSNLPQSVFTAKQNFYMKTCSFSLNVYLWSKSQNLPFTSEEIIKFLSEDYSKMILVQSYTVESWSNELLSCIAHIIGLMCSSCWWGGQKPQHIELIVSSKDTVYEHIFALIRLVSYQPFHERISAQFYNDETVLMDTSLIFLFGMVQIYDLDCFISSQTNLPAILWSIAQTSSYDRIRACAYGFLAEILSDKQLKELKISDNICEFFFHILEQAWNHPTKKWKKITIPYLLKGYLSLSSNDTIQTTTANSNKISLFIELCDHYPMAFDIIWALSFNSIIVKQLQSNELFKTKLVQINHQTNDENMRKIVNGILWNLNSNREENILSDNSHEKKFDIMISYSHKEKQICKQLYEELSQLGYRIWIDFDQMHGNVMDAMVEAIEQSRTIMICMSEQYQRSNYCRAEAQYAFQKQLNIIPILLQKHYKPDGWLAFLIGSLLYIDFTKYEYSKAFDMLMKELKMINERNEISTKPVQTKLNTVGSLPVSSCLIQSSSQSITFPENVQDWTEIHVHRWLSENDLPQMARILSGMDGLNLIYLSEYIIKSEPQQILSLLQHDSLRRINENISLIEISRFRTLIERKNLLMFISTKQMLKVFQQKKTSAIPFIYQCLLSVPPDYESDKTEKRWPLLLFLHGAGESHSPIDKVLKHGPPKLVHTYSSSKEDNHSSDNVNMECAQLVAENFITCSPQVDRGYVWDSTVLSGLLDELEQTYRIDKNKIYVTGISMGGYGTWSLAMDQPTRFAAIIPICGGGDCQRVSLLKHLPIWNFHGKLDNVIPVTASSSLIKALDSPLCKSTIYPNIKHDSWTETYNNPEIYKWLLEQTKNP
ncbi:unnamed protein product [Rotaria sordida]|uniref:TIR domain-containing protein n=1 Tax=Rotaria sordida TaxID=392033 RepID=A0A819D651_9BILA|nr:unnamed protein product [Rotaria sordida]CAF3830156.1 unnamed protein product [Rotaria sordida]